MILKNIKEEIAKVIGIDSVNFVYPPNNDLGDLSLPLFSLPRKDGEGLSELSSRLKGEIEPSSVARDRLDRIEIAGPYLNFFIKQQYLIAETIKLILNRPSDFFNNNNGRGEKVIFEYSNANTHKEIHIGHLRNIVLGDSLLKIFQTNGFDAHSVSFINDLGINTAKAVWAYKQGYSENIGECYAWAVAEEERRPEISEEISQIMNDIENQRGDNYQVWGKTRELSLQDFKNIYSLLDVSFDKTYFESDFTERGREIVDDFLGRGIFKKSQGAIIADLEKYQLGVLPVVRSDGTSLYAVADLALAERKDADFSDLKKSFIVVDVRQSLHFKQLFKILELAGYQNDFTHLSYDFVKLPTGMMSSRSGKIVLLQDLYQQVLDKLIIETRERHQNWEESRVVDNSKELAVAILKFEMLKVSPSKIITFNIEEALRFEGYGALYILYAVVRMKSILRKADFKLSGSEGFDGLAEKLNSRLEKTICLEILKYQDVLLKAQEGNDPSEIAKYLFSFVKIFNDYYQQVNILQAEDDLRQSRLTLLQVCIVLVSQGLSLLGIKGTINEI